MPEKTEAKLTFSSKGYESKTAEVRLQPDRQLVNKDVVLDSLDDSNEILTYHTQQEMTEAVHQLANTYPSLAKAVSLESTKDNSQVTGLLLSR